MLFLCPFSCHNSPQVAKLKSDEREDLKVLATGVAAALAARKVMLSIKFVYFVKSCVSTYPLKYLLCNKSEKMALFFLLQPYQVRILT